LVSNVVPRTPAGLYHLLLFVAFFGLFIATGLVTLEHDTPLHFYFGAFYQVYKFAVDTVVLLLVVACGLFLAPLCRQQLPCHQGPEPEENARHFENRMATAFPYCYPGDCITGFMLEGFVLLPPAESSGLGYLESLWPRVLSHGSRWLHSSHHLVDPCSHHTAFFASIPFTKMRHMFLEYL